MTIADPKFFRPWRKSMGYTRAKAAETLGMSAQEYRELEDSGRFLRLHLAAYTLSGALLALGVVIAARWIGGIPTWAIWFALACGAAGGAAICGVIRESEP